LPFSFGLESRKSEDVWSDVGLVSSWSMNGAGDAGAAPAADVVGIGSNFPPKGLFVGFAGTEGATIGFAGSGGGTCGASGFIVGAWDIGVAATAGREAGGATKGFGALATGVDMVAAGVGAVKVFPVDHPAADATGAGFVEIG